jgi:hypothetical protein
VPVLNTADQVYLGATKANAVYAGTTKVWWRTGIDSIPDMTLWVEADDYPATTDGSISSAPTRVGPSLSGFAYLVQDGINGLASFNFDLSSQQGLDAYNITLGPDVTMFAVVNAGAQPAQYADLMDFNHAAGGGWVIQQDNYGPGNYFAWRVSSAYSLATNPAPYPGTPCVVEVHKQGGHVTFTVGASTIDFDGSAGLDMVGGQLRIGNYVNGGNRGFTGQISMVAGWNRALTPAEMDQVRGYVKDKWFPAPPIPVTDGLLGWYEMSSLAALADQAPVVSWPDTSGNGLDLTAYVATPRYVVDGGDGNPAVSWWDGNTRAFQSATNTGLTGGAPWTQVVIFKLGSAVTQSITGIGTPGTAQMTDLMAYNNTFIGHMHGGGNDTIAYGPPPITADGAFHSLAAVNNGGMRLSVDGVNQTSPWPGVLALVNAPFRVGLGMYSGFAGLGGGSAIRGVALYNRALTPAEVSAVASALAT